MTTPNMAALAALHAALAAALLAGEPTTKIRAALASATAEAVDSEQRRAALDAEQQRTIDAELAEATARIIGEAAGRLIELNAALTPPSAPWGADR